MVLEFVEHFTGHSRDLKGTSIVDKAAERQRVSDVGLQLGCGVRVVTCRCRGANLQQAAHPVIALRKRDDQFTQLIDIHRLHRCFQHCLGRIAGCVVDRDPSGVDRGESGRDQMLAEVAVGMMPAGTGPVGERTGPVELDLVDVLGLDRRVGLVVGGAEPSDITDVVFAPGVDQVTGHLEQRRFGERHITMVPDSWARLSGDLGSRQ